MRERIAADPSQVAMVRLPERRGRRMQARAPNCLGFCAAETAYAQLNEIISCHRRPVS